jgi:hypothetical protein
MLYFDTRLIKRPRLTLSERMSLSSFSSTIDLILAYSSSIRLASWSFAAGNIYCRMLRQLRHTLRKCTLPASDGTILVISVVRSWSMSSLLSCASNSI